MSKPQSPPTSPPIFDKIALIGIGLIGGSIALAARRGGLAGKIVAATRSAETAATARPSRINTRSTRAFVRISAPNDCAAEAHASPTAPMPPSG